MPRLPSFLLGWIGTWAESGGGCLRPSAAPARPRRVLQLAPAGHRPPPRMRRGVSPTSLVLVVVRLPLPPPTLLPTPIPPHPIHAAQHQVGPGRIRPGRVDRPGRRPPVSRLSRPAISRPSAGLSPPISRLWLTTSKRLLTRQPAAQEDPPRRQHADAPAGREPRRLPLAQVLWLPGAVRPRPRRRARPLRALVERPGRPQAQECQGRGPLLDPEGPRRRCPPGRERVYDLRRPRRPPEQCVLAPLRSAPTLALG